MNFAPQNRKKSCHLKSKRAIVITGPTTNKTAKPKTLAKGILGVSTLSPKRAGHQQILSQLQ